MKWCSIQGFDDYKIVSYRFFERIFIYELISWYILHIYLFTYGTMIVSKNHNHFFGFYLLKDVTTRFEDYDSQIEDEWFILIFQNFTKKLHFLLELINSLF